MLYKTGVIIEEFFTILEMENFMKDIYISNENESYKFWYFKKCSLRLCS